MNNYKNNAKLNWGIFVCGFWIRVSRIATVLSTFAIRKSTERIRKNLELISGRLSEEHSQDLTEIREILEKL